MGCPTHNRVTNDEKNTPGLFVELFPLTVKLNDDESFSELFQSIRKQVTSFLKHATPGSSQVSHSRQFNVVLNYIKSEFDDFHDMPCDVRWIHNGHMDPQHDLRVQIMSLKNNQSMDHPIEMYFDVNDNLMDEDKGQQAVTHFLALFDQLIDNPDLVINQAGLIPLIKNSENDETDNTYTALKAELSKTRNTLYHGSVLDMFIAQVNLHPEKTALIQGHDKVSYQQLDNLSTALADTVKLHLEPSNTESRINKENRIAIYCHRSIELITAILACHKCGAAYIPLESSSPEKRLQHIIEQAQPSVILHDRKQPESVLDTCFATTDREISRIPIDINALSSIAPLASSRHADIDPETPAYIMYTSGSTGAAKGVIVSHHSLSQYICWAMDTYIPQECTKANLEIQNKPCMTPCSMPFYSSFGFDLTITSIFMPLCTGGQMHIYPEEQHSFSVDIRTVILDNQVSIIKLTPAHLGLLDDLDLKNSKAHTLIVGGENLKTEVAYKVHQQFDSNIRIFNEYGPTEAVVGCMSHLYSPSSDTESSVPIGTAADNLRIYLLDTSLNPVPNGVNGEIFIAGKRLSDGYLNQSALTAEKFLDDPFVSHEKMYRSGDIARINSNGQMIYLGRQDQQIKINGVRIEAAEIEHALNSFPGITQSYVSPHATPHVSPYVSLFSQPSESSFHSISNQVEENQATKEELIYCANCGICSNYPDIRFDHNQVCNICIEYEQYKDQAKSYFGTLSEFNHAISKLSQKKRGDYDCLVLLSGGKDSTYMLYQVVNQGFKVMSMTLDNGYISEGAKTNIAQTVADLKVDHRFVSTAYMKDIFADSLTRHNSVCYGCFKTIYTLSINLAHAEGIPTIITGLSRGQLFETRLIKQVFQQSEFNPEKLDHDVLQTRKIYHRVADAVTAYLDMSLFDDDQVFEQVQFIDFYRYCDVSMDKMYAFLNTHAPWTRPKDTGRSTNCLINDTGIYVHKKTRGYHNYALPYSWDVRLGHKTREQAIAELNDEIDHTQAHKILRDINYLNDDMQNTLPSVKLVAYYQSDQKLDGESIRYHLKQHLLREMIPDYFINVESFPLNTNGKVDLAALPSPILEKHKSEKQESDQHGTSETASDWIPASTPLEQQLTSIWQRVLRKSKLSINDNFFDIGGDSITAIQIITQAGRENIYLTPNILFENQTIRNLAEYLDRTMAEEKNTEPTSHSANKDNPALEAIEQTRKPLIELDDKQLSKLAEILGE